MCKEYGQESKYVSEALNSINLSMAFLHMQTYEKSNLQLRHSKNANLAQQWIAVTGKG